MGKPSSNWHIMWGKPVWSLSGSPRYDLCDLSKQKKHTCICSLSQIHTPTIYSLHLSICFYTCICAHEYIKPRVHTYIPYIPYIYIYIAHISSYIKTYMDRYFHAISLVKKVRKNPRPRRISPPSPSWEESADDAPRWHWGRPARSDTDDFWNNQWSYPDHGNFHK